MARRGRVIGRRGGGGSTPLARARTAFAGLFTAGDSWFEASNTSGSDWVDYNDPTHKLVLTSGVLAAAASDSAFGGAMTLSYTGTQRSVSNRAASAWKSESDGTGSTRIFLAVTTNTGGVQVFVSTAATGTTGSQIYGSGTTPGWGVYSGASQFINATNGSLITSGVGFAITNRYSSSAWDFRWNGATIVSGGATTPDTGSPGAPLTVGSDGSGGNFATARYPLICDFRRVLTTNEMAIAAAYVLAKTGKVL